MPPPNPLPPMPGSSYAGPLPPLSESQRALAAELERDVRHLAETIGDRHVGKPAKLREAAEFVARSFAAAGYEVRREGFDADGVRCENLDVELPGGAKRDEVIVVGAHYDSIPGCPAANDNASGVAATLALARRFAAAHAAGHGDRPAAHPVTNPATRSPTRSPARTLRFVAFVNEEPPYFHGPLMGSYVYAQGCKQRGEKIAGMMSLETIGYYSDAPGSQHYPDPYGQFYPTTGNFIAFVGDSTSTDWVRAVVGAFRQHARFPSEGAAAPAHITGIGFSDQWSFWQFGYPALMVTDTAPFRYPHYHRPTDTPDQIDYGKTARVVEGIEKVVEELVG